ncbi:hypothetical protein BGZ63DRAFT_394088 [Mariannaea sp. PMI_226]|nr:hypothetical protein BGZ63DRAFT_394088 [Mariannaea sp. PMI_226]
MHSLLKAVRAKPGYGYGYGHGSLRKWSVPESWVPKTMMVQSETEPLLSIREIPVRRSGQGLSGSAYRYYVV